MADFIAEAVGHQTGVIHGTALNAVTAQALARPTQQQVGVQQDSPLTTLATQAQARPTQRQVGALQNISRISLDPEFFAPATLGSTSLVAQSPRGKAPILYAPAVNVRCVYPVELGLPDLESRFAFPATEPLCAIATTTDVCADADFVSFAANPLIANSGTGGGGSGSGSRRPASGMVYPRGTK